MAKTLYPVFEIPSLNPINSDEEKTLKASPLFDFEIGDFVRDGANRVIMTDGREAYKSWVLKVLNTQRAACLSYIETGIDQEGALSEPTREAVESAFERTITDALLRNVCTERVCEFEFAWDIDVLTISFVVKPKSWSAFDASLNVVL